MCSEQGIPNPARNAEGNTVPTEQELTTKGQILGDPTPHGNPLAMPVLLPS